GLGRLAHGAMASTSKSLAKINKSPDVGKATNKHSALRDAAGRLSRGAIFDCDKPDFILKNGPWNGRKLYHLYKATEPPREWFPELLLHARKIGITIFSSVFSPEDVDFLEQFNPPAYEIASADRPFALWSKSRRAKCIT